MIASQSRRHARVRTRKPGLISAAALALALLSGAALLIITGLVLLLWSWRPTPPR